ncbi:MAG: PadR family transcriptional regulator [Actinomycetota bacterium]
MGARQTELLQGTLDMLILKTLALGPLHGVGIADRIEQVTRGTFQVGAGSLFPALHRMQERGWLKSAWGETRAGHRAKFYELTGAGRKQLQAETQRWKTISLAVSRAMETD